MALRSPGNHLDGLAGENGANSIGSHVKARKM